MTTPARARARAYYAPGGDPQAPGRSDAWVIALPPTRAGAIATATEVIYTAPGYEGPEAAALLALITPAELMELSLEAFICQARLRRAERAASDRPHHLRPRRRRAPHTREDTPTP